MPTSEVAHVLGKQILRSGTSVCAHYREAVRTRSDGEIISKLEGGMQELEETMYWIELLAGHRILQFSIQRIAASQRKDNSIGDAFNELIDALLDSDVIPYIRDIHLAYDYDLESHLQALAYQLGHPILGDADRLALATLFEYSPELEQHYVPVFVEEPSLATMENLLDAWAAA